MSTDLTGLAGNAFGTFFSSAIVQLFVTAAILYLFVVWLAAAFWAFRDMHERSENPVLPYVAAGLIILCTPFLFALGVVVYRVIRPPERLGEIYERNLAEEALLAEVETVRSCPGCARRVHDDWIICPICRTRLNRVCANCGRLVGLDWSLCAWCGKDFERADIAALSPISGGLSDRDRLDSPTAANGFVRNPARSALLRTPQPQPRGERAEPEAGRGALWSSAPRPAPGPGPSSSLPER